MFSDALLARRVFRTRTIRRFAMATLFLAAVALPLQESCFSDEPSEPDASGSILDKLEMPSNLELTEVTLTDMLANLEEKIGDSIHLDRRALAEEGIELNDQTIDHVRPGKMKLASLLDMTLRSFGLDWLVEDEALIVTTQEAAQKTMLRPYDVRELAKNDEANVHELAKVVARAMELEEKQVLPFRQVLIVRASFRKHRQLQAFLSELDAALSD